MALNIKVALITCVVFIGGMCWVVNMVARPMLEIPAPAVGSATLAASEQYLARAVVDPDEHLAFESPAVVTRDYAGMRMPQLVVEAPQRLPEFSGDLGADPATAQAFALPEQVAVHEPPKRRAMPIAILDADVEMVDVPDEEVHGDIAVASAVTVEDIVTQRPERSNAIVAVPVSTNAMLTNKPEPDRPVQPEVGVERYVVQSGDSLGKIAQRFWGTARPEALELLVACNEKLADSNLIVIGDELLIPSMADAKRMRDNELESASRVPAAAPSESRKSGRLYTVQESDTLSKIAAEQLNDSRRWIEIAQLNNMKDADQIRVGSQLLLPTRSDT